MKRRLVALVLGATITTVPAIARAQTDEQQTFPDVPMYRVDPARQAVHPGPAPGGVPSVAWSVPIGAGHEHQPILHQGTLLYGTWDGRVLALDPATGSERWSWQGSGPISHLVAGDGAVFVGDESGVIRALDVATGEERWSLDMEIETFGARVTLADGVLYAPDGDGTVYGIDPTTGEATWSWDGPVPITSVTVVDGAGYFGGNDGRVYSVNVTDGTERWRPVQLLSAMVSSMGVVDGWLYVSALQGPGQATGELYAIDAASGEVEWRFRGPSGRQIAASVADGIAYAASEADGLYALDARTGAQLWHVEGRRWYAVPAIVGSALYLASPDGFVTAYDREDGRRLWEVTVGSGIAMPLAISGGLIFLGDDTGTLMALGEGPALAAAEPVSAPEAADDDVLELVTTWDATTVEGLDGPSGMDLGPDGNLYMVNAGRNEIVVLDPEGGVVRRWGETGSTDGAFDFLRDPGDPFSAIGGVAVAADGSVYVADTVNRRIQKFDHDGGFQLSWGSYGDGDGQFLEPFDLDIGPDGTVYVVDDVRDDIQRFTADGKYLQTIGRHGTGPGELNFTASIVVAPDGTLINGDWSNHRVQAWDADGDFLWSLGSRGSDPGEFGNPSDVAVDGAGRLYVTDGPRIQVFDPGRTVVGVWSVPEADGEWAGVGPIVAMPDGTVVAGGYEQIFKLRLKG